MCLFDHLRKELAVGHSHGFDLKAYKLHLRNIATFAPVRSAKVFDGACHLIGGAWFGGLSFGILARLKIRLYLHTVDVVIVVAEWILLRLLARVDPGVFVSFGHGVGSMNLLPSVIAYSFVHLG